MKNCQKYNQEGNCVKCNTQYYLTDTYECEKVLDSSIIENCEEYVTMF